MNNQKQPSYYAIIPATIRYDERLKYAERLFYGEITALIGKEGYCFASNNYFAEIYGVIPGTISRWISHLSKLGYIRIELIRDDKKAIIERRIYITDISCKRVVQDTYKPNNTYPYEQNSTYTISKKAKSNNINIMIDRFFYYIVNNKGEIPKDFKNVEQFQEFYEIIERFGLNYTKDMLNTFKEENIKKLQIVVYAIKEMFINNKGKLLLKATREIFFEVYDSCKSFEISYQNTDNEIKSFFYYYYISMIRKLEARQ